MKEIQIKGTAFLTFFGKEGIKIGNSFYEHHEWKSFTEEDRENMSRLEYKDFLNNEKRFVKMYKSLIEEN